MADAERTFNELMGELDYPMLIVTTAAGGERAGCLVGFATQCSIDPPRFLVCLSTKNRTLGVAERSEGLIVHFPGAGADQLVELFGAETGDEIDKFARCEWHEGPGGMPVLDGCPRWFAGTVLERISLGDHVGFLLAPCEAEQASESEPFPFQRAKRLDPGHPQ